MARTDVEAEVAGTVWKLVAETGAELDAGDTILVLESMKMEVPVEAPVSGRVLALHVGEDDPVDEGQVVAVLEH